MGRWLELVDRLEKEKRERERGYDKNDINDKSLINSCASDVGCNQEGTFGRINRLCRTAGEEERRIIEWLGSQLYPEDCGMGAARVVTILRT